LGLTAGIGLVAIRGLKWIDASAQAIKRTTDEAERAKQAFNSFMEVGRMVASNLESAFDKWMRTGKASFVKSLEMDLAKLLLAAAMAGARMAIEQMNASFGARSRQLSLLSGLAFARLPLPAPPRLSLDEVERIQLSGGPHADVSLDGCRRGPGHRAA
jgi:hypothetical protein